MGIEVWCFMDYSSTRISHINKWYGLEYQSLLGLIWPFSRRPPKQHARCGSVVARRSRLVLCSIAVTSFPLFKWEGRKTSGTHDIITPCIRRPPPPPLADHTAQPFFIDRGPLDKAGSLKQWCRLAFIDSDWSRCTSLWRVSSRELPSPGSLISPFISPTQPWKIHPRPPEIFIVKS